MASDVDIVIAVATAGVADVYKLSNAMQQLNAVVRGSVAPMNNLSARSKALSAAVGSADSSLKAHAKTIDQLSRNNSVLTNEIGRVRKEIAGMGTEFKFATGASASFRKAAVSDLKAYESALKGIRLRGLTEDLKSVAQEQKRLGKDAQFVGRSLIIGLTTPMVGFARYGLQALVSVDKEFVRLNKVLENVAPNLEAAAKKMNVDLVGATKEQSKQLQGMVDRYDRLDKSLGKISNRFGLAKSLTVGLAGDFAELGIQSEESIAKITELAAVTEKLGDMDIGAAKDLVQSLYFQAQRAMQMSGQSRKMTFEEREIAAIGAATAQLNLFNSVENVTALTLRDLGDAFPEVAAAGSSFGLSMTELAGMLAPMKAAGFEVGASANSIKVSLQRLVAPTKQNADLFRRLSKEYDTNFTAIKGTGLDAIQSLIDGFNELKNSAAGQEGAMEFFAKVFGVRQGPRMEVALAQMADFDEVLKSNTVSLESAEKKLQGFANQAIISANKSSNANLPLIKSYQDIGIIARIATAQIKEGETAQIDGFGRVTLAQVKEARKVRQAVTDEIVKAQRTEGVDLIGQVNTEAGRASFIQLAGAANAAEVAQRELDVALGSLDTQISILKNNFKAFATDIIKGARPAIEKITDISNKLITAWSSLDSRTKQLISTVALLVAGATAAIGPLIFVFGQFRLAMGSVAKVLLSFLPSLKTLSVEAVASSSAMLRLSKPLTVVGDTVVNTNGKFATFLATLASGEGPVGRLANKIGLMTGALQEQSTAPMALSRQVNAQKAVRESLAPITGTSVIDPITGAPVAAKPSFTSQMKSALKLQKTGVMSGAAGVRGPGGRMGPMDADEREILRKTEEMIKQSLLAKGYPTTGGRGPGGRFSKSVGDMVQEAVALQASGVTSGAAGIRGASGRFRRMTTGEKDALQAYEDTRETLEKRTLAKRTLSRKNLDLDVFTGQNMYKGREITADRASDIYRGGIKGRAAQVAEAVGRSREAAPDRIKELGGTAKGLATAPIEGYKKSVKGAKDAMLALRMQHAAAGVEAPRFFARMSAAMKGFVTSTNLGTAALKIMKLTLIASGIGIIILAIGVAVMLVMKNLDSFKKAGSSGIKTVKEAFTTVKDAVLELVRPIIDLFAHFGNGAKGSEGAVQGLGKAFSGIAVVFKFVANVFKMIVEKFIKPYLYMIINIVGAVVSLFQGNWKKAFSFLMAAVAFAAEFFVNAFAIGFKVIVSLAGGLVKGVVSLIGLLAKGMIEYLVWPITGVLKLASMLPFGIGDKFKGINNKFRSVVNGAKGMVDSATSVVNSTVDKATGAVNGLIDKSAKGIKNKLGGLKKGGIDASKGKVTLGGKGKKDDNVEVDTDPMQEQIANATGEGLSEGADEGAKELAKRAAQALKDIKKEVQEEIASRIKDAMTAVVDSITNSLKDQKEASLSIYDAQIKKIEDVAKAEEKLTKEQEYQNKLREAEEQRALNRLNTRRNYAMAVYAGQIDEARAIADAGARQDTEDTKSIGVIRDERVKELAEENRKVMIDSIKEAKENASKYFDEMIKSFTEAAKKITQFPPTTAEEFNTMLNQLIDGGNGFVGAKSIANSMGTIFSESFGGALGQLGVNASGPLTSSLAAIGKTLTENNPFGPTGIWSKTIDASIDALTRKYTGLSQTLTTVIDTNSEAFSKLLTTYTAYQDIVNPAGAGGSSSSGGSGGGGTGAGGSGAGAGGTGTGGGTGNETGFNNLKKGKVTPNQLARVMFANYRNADRNLLVDYLTDAFTIFTKPPVDSSANKFKKFLTENPAIKQTKNSRILTMVRNAYNTGSRSEGYDGYKLYEMGGMLPYSKGGPTEGPVQQGIPAILHGGEYVVRNSAVNKYGWGMMQQINQGTYKPRPFANGGMIDSFAKGGAIKKPKKMVTGGKSKAPEKAPDKKIKEDPAQAEWNWQQNNGGFTEAYMDTIAKGESSQGKNWGKKPDWFGRVETSHGWMGGGMRTADKTWFDYGGSEFAKTADLATKLQQMVVKNRIAIFGWIRKVAAGSPGFPAGATISNPPLGTGEHAFNRDLLLKLERVTFKGKPEKLKKYRSPEKEFPLPENFNPNMSYINQVGYDPFKNFGSDKGAFNTKTSKDAYVNYFRNKPRGFNKITMPFSKPVWIDGFGNRVREPKNARNFDNFGAYSPLIQEPVQSFSFLDNILGFAKGGLVGKAVGKKIAKPKTPEKPKTPSAADFRKADYLSDWDMQVIGVNAKKQMAEQKKGLFGKIKSAVAKPFVAAKNWVSNQFYSNLYGSQTGSGMTGSAVMLNRATNPNYETVGPRPSMLDLPSVRAGATMAKTGTQFLPIAGAFFPLADAANLYNENPSGGSRVLSGLEAAGSLIGPTSIFSPYANFSQGSKLLNTVRSIKSLPKNIKSGTRSFINNRSTITKVKSLLRDIDDARKGATKFPAWQDQVLGGPRKSMDQLNQSLPDPLFDDGPFGSIEGLTPYKRITNSRYPNIFKEISGERAPTRALGVDGWLDIPGKTPWETVKNRIQETKNLNINRFKNLNTRFKNTISKKPKIGNKLKSLPPKAKAIPKTLKDRLFEFLVPKSATILGSEGISSVVREMFYTGQYDDIMKNSILNGLSQRFPTMDMPELTKLTDIMFGNIKRISPENPAQIAETMRFNAKRVAEFEAKLAANASRSPEDALAYKTYMTNKLRAKITGNIAKSAQGRTGGFKRGMFKQGDLSFEDFMKNIVPKMDESELTKIAGGTHRDDFKIYLSYMNSLLNSPMTYQSGTKYYQDLLAQISGRSEVTDLQKAFPILKEFVNASIAGNVRLGPRINFADNFDLAKAIEIFGVKTEKDLEFVRGMNIMNTGGLKATLSRLVDVDPKIGEMLPHQTPLRTSSSPAGALGFFSRGTPDQTRGALFNITVPKGTPAYVDPKFLHETELLFPGFNFLENIRKPISAPSGASLFSTRAGFSISPTNFNFDNLTRVGEQLGSNRAGIWRDPAGIKYYIKESKSVAHSWNEELAARLYESFGVASGQQRAVFDSSTNTPYLISQIIEDLKPIGEFDDLAIRLPRIKEGFAIDAWLGNYDAIGYNMDNLMLDALGNPIRIDPGASMFYRGTGGLKDAIPGIKFGEEVEELTQMVKPTDAHKSFQNAGKIFGDMTFVQLQDAARRLQLLPSGITSDTAMSSSFSNLLMKMIQASIPDQALAQKYFDILMARRKNILEHFGLQVPDDPGAISGSAHGWFNGGLISRANGGMIPGFGSQGVPAMLHGGEYVVNSSAVKNVGIAALQALNNMRFNTPKSPSYSGPVNGQSTSTSTTHIYVENFIGEKQWFESMMKDYNVTVAPQNQKAAGLNNTTISTYSGINRGL